MGGMPTGGAPSGPVDPRVDAELDRADVLGLVALTTRHDVELDGLTLLEVLEATPGDAGVVHEDIGAALAGDEAVALLGIEKLDCACGHFDFFFQQHRGRRCD